MFAKVSHGDKGAWVSDLRDIFRTGQRDYTIEMAWKKWQICVIGGTKTYRAFKLMHNKKSILTHMGSVVMEHKAFDRLPPNITCDKILFPD